MVLDAKRSLQVCFPRLSWYILTKGPEMPAEGEAGIWIDEQYYHILTPRLSSWCRLPRIP